MGALRLFLAVSVLATHLRYGRGIFGFSFLNGGLAVQCFFVISGFYMALVLSEKYNYRGAYRDFIQQRFLRLYPAYLLVGLLILALEGLASWALGRPYGLYAVWTQPPYCLTALSVAYYSVVNLAILGLDSLWFFQQDVTTGRLLLTPDNLPGTRQCIDYVVNGPTWTLGVELAFYLVAPFLVRKPIRVQAAFALASLALRSAFWFALSPKESLPWTYYFSPSDLFFFMAGSIGYRIYRIHRGGLEKFAAKYVWIFPVFLLLCLVSGRLPMKENFFWFFVPAAIVLVPLLFAHTRNNRIDRFIGELSYPYYLIHFHIVMAVEAVLGERHNAIFGPACALVTFGLAVAFYQLIEVRTEHFRERLFQHITARRAARFS